MIWPLTLIPRWSGVPRPSTERFDGLTVLITGSSSGLGLEAAKKLAAAGAANLIITTRDQSKGQATKAAIEAHLRQHNIRNPCNIIPLELEMSDPASLRTFIANLKQTTQHLDHVILNAGLMSTKHNLLAATGFEESIQVNAISTALLSLYLLTFLNASALTKNPDIASRPHLAFISSYAAWMFNPSKTPILDTTSTPLRALSEADNFPPQTLAGMADQYGRSKLMLEHLIRRIAVLPYLSDPENPSQPRILVNSVDPGPTQSEIFNKYNASWVERMFLYLFNLAMKPTEQGANAFITALGLGQEMRGQMWMNDEVVGQEKLVNVESEQGIKVGEKVWREFIKVVEAESAELRDETLLVVKNH